MKRILCLLFIVLSFAVCSAQQKNARVTLKSGVTITGTITELNPVSHLIIQVAGINSRIEMADVSLIEDITSDDNKDTLTEVNNAISSHIDQSIYPESYTLKIGPYDIEMILIRGALFDMGYDGRGSTRKNSEPVHKVQLSSFYVNKTFLTKDFVTYLKKGTESHDDKSRRYSPGSSKDALSVAEAIASKVNLPIGLITEAQCEYILTTDNIDRFVFERIEYLWCRDYYADYLNTSQPQVDPIGPKEGKNHVIRAFSAKGDEVYTRYSTRNSSMPSGIRISVPASALFPQ